MPLLAISQLVKSFIAPDGERTVGGGIPPGLDLWQMWTCHGQAAIV